MHISYLRLEESGMWRFQDHMWFSHKRFRGLKFRTQFAVPTFNVLVSSNSGLGVFLPNRAWPDINSIDPTWKKLQDPLLRVLCSTPVIFTEAGGGKWLPIKEAIFDRLQENEARELLLQVLLEAHQNVATLPDHVIQCITSHTHAISEVTPSFVRVVFKNTPSCYRPLGRTEKLCLLKFVLKDDLFSELQGLELLPLSDGTFATFKSSDVFAVYMPSPEHPAKLLPGLRHRILAQDIGVEILAKLKEVAEEGNNLM